MEFVMNRTFNEGNRTFPPKIGESSPWGEIEAVDETGPGSVYVTTGGHGGIVLEDSFQEKMPEVASKFGEYWAHGYGVGWYEEDSAAQLPPLYVPDAFDEKTQAYFAENASNIVANFKTDMYGNIELPEPVTKS